MSKNTAWAITTNSVFPVTISNYLWSSDISFMWQNTRESATSLLQGDRFSYRMTVLETTSIAFFVKAIFIDVNSAIPAGNHQFKQLSCFCHFAWLWLRISSVSVCPCAPSTLQSFALSSPLSLQRTFSKFRWCSGWRRWIHGAPPITAASTTGRVYTSNCWPEGSRI